MPTGITAKLKRQVSLFDIFQAIASTLDSPAITQAINPDEQFQKVREALSNQSTLLIIDNLETIEDKEAHLGLRGKWYSIDTIIGDMVGL